MGHLGALLGTCSFGSNVILGIELANPQLDRSRAAHEASNIFLSLHRLEGFAREDTTGLSVKASKIVEELLSEPRFVENSGRGDFTTRKSRRPHWWTS